METLEPYEPHKKAYKKHTHILRLLKGTKTSHLDLVVLEDFLALYPRRLQLVHVIMKTRAGYCDYVLGRY